MLFLGEWCRQYDRKAVWSALDATVAEPYGLDVARKQRDVAYVQALADQLLIELSAALNAFHGVQHGVRYWNMVLGHWLQRYVAVVFNRYATLEQAFEKYRISGTTVFAADGYCLAAPESDSFVRSCNDPVWNHVLYANILRFMARCQLDVDSQALQGVQGFASAAGKPATAPKRGLRHKAVDAATGMLRRFYRNSDAVISGSTLPLPVEAKLQLRLGQVPQLWPSPGLRRVELDRERRKQFVLNTSETAGLKAFLRAQLPDMIPVCYLEGYSQLVRDAEALPWPANPKFIFTSVRFGADELFKAWAAAKVEQLGTPYYVGQHGNNYGTHIYAGNAKWPERVTSDRFFSWGWSEEGTNTVPAIIFREAGREPERYDPVGGLLLIEKCNPPMIWPWDRYAEFGRYQEEQFGFVESLPPNVRSALTVRLHYEHSGYRWFEDQRWRDRCPDVRLEKGVARLRDMIAQSRLVVHSYDSTGFLETLIANVPSICFTQDTFELAPDAQPAYQMLRDAGLLVESPQQAAQAVEQHWDNVEAWWNGPTVQNARLAFCARYARMTEDPISTMKELLTA